MQHSNDTILVTGATGEVGGHVIRTLSALNMKDPTLQLHIRAIVRDPLTTKAKLLMDNQQVRVFVANFQDNKSLDLALAGVNRVFLVCANTPDQDELEKKFLDACVRCSINYIVKISTYGPLVGNPRVGYGKAHGIIEKYLKELQPCIPYTILQPNWFMSNLFRYPSFFEGYWTNVIGDTTRKLIDPRDVAAFASALLTCPKSILKVYEFKTFAISGPENLTTKQITIDVSNVMGGEVKVKNVSFEELRCQLIKGGLTEKHAGWVVESNKVRKVGLIPEPSTTSTLFTLPHAPKNLHTLKQFLADYAHVFKRKYEETKKIKKSNL